ncbi:MAG: hypothetical protein H6742_04355 [Alphaproteobacteria bacterium]|nr:hypothetical protein [Alphaproteobacteria bacterium]
MPRRTDPTPSTEQRRIEELGRRLHATGAPTWFVPAVGHAGSRAPVLAYALAMVAALGVGLLRPLPGIALCLAVLGAVLLDLQGRQSWLRRLIPRRAGWAVAAEVAPGSGPDAPTLVVWASANPARSGPGARTGLVQVALGAALAGTVAGVVGVLLHGAHPDVGRIVVLVAGASICLVAGLVLAVGRAGRLPPPGAAPADLLAAVAPRLRAWTGNDTRVLVAAGSLGAPWHDELEHLLADKRLALRRDRTALLCLEAGAHPLAAIARDGTAVPRRAPPTLLAALQESGLPLQRGWTGATRATRLGLPAIGLAGLEATEGDGPRRVEGAVRCMVQVLSH